MYNLICGGGCGKLHIIAVMLIWKKITESLRMCIYMYMEPTKINTSYKKNLITKIRIFIIINNFNYMNLNEY